MLLVQRSSESLSEIIRLSEGAYSGEYIAFRLPDELFGIH